MKLTKHLKFGILFFGISLLIWTCAQDEEIKDTEDVMQTEGKDYTLERISYEQLISDPEIQESLSIISRNFDNNKVQELNNRTTTEVAEGLTIITDYINRIVSGGTITWTFGVETQALENSDLENFMVKKYNDEFSYFLISYEKDHENEDNLFERVVSYQIAEEYLTLDDLDLASRTPLDWVPEEDGGGENECEGEVYQVVVPCDVGGTHGPTYCCQHGTPHHGCSYVPPCSDVCSGTSIETVTVDFNGCVNGEDMSGDPVGGDAPNDNQISGGTNPPEDSDDNTYSATVGIIDGEAPCEDVEEPYDINGICGLQFSEVCMKAIGNTQALGLRQPNLGLIEDYIYANGCDAVDKVFIDAAISAIAQGGEVDFEENIIYKKDLLDDFPCQKLIIEQASGTCSPITQVILDIFEANDNVNLVFDVSDAISVNANTDVFTVYNQNSGACSITITFRESYLETATDLSIARTTIHESLHAIFAYMYEEELLISPDGSPLEGFEDLLDAYVNYLSDLPANFSSAHHELMADFVQDIATSLSFYGSENNHNIPFSYYKRLSWGGLTGTDSFNTLYPELIDPILGSIPENINVERYDVIYSIVAEQENSAQSFNLDGTIYEYIQKGHAPNSSEPCD